MGTCDNRTGREAKVEEVEIITIGIMTIIQTCDSMKHHSLEVVIKMTIQISGHSMSFNQYVLQFILIT